jgi:opacity protein-like surface antigen
MGVADRIRMGGDPMAIDRRVLQSVVLGTLLVVLALRPGFAAEAEAEADPARSGPYAGLGLVYGAPIFDLEASERAFGSGSLGDSPGFGVDVRGGYRFHPHFAAEGNFQWVGGMDIEQAGHDLGDVSPWTFTANMKAFILTGTFQPYVVGGVGIIHVKGDESVDLALPDSTTGFTGRIGAGADYYLRPNIVLNVEFTAVMPAGQVSRFRYLPLAAGAQYRF